MTQRANVLFKIGWISLAIIGVAILAFGLIVTVVPASSEPPYLRAIGVASIGMGMFGLQVVFIVLSLVGLLLPVREFFPRRRARAPMTS